MNAENHLILGILSAAESHNFRPHVEAYHAHVRAEVLNEAADKQRKFILSDEFVCDDWEAALQVVDLIAPTPGPVPDETAGDKTGEGITQCSVCHMHTNAGDHSHPEAEPAPQSPASRAEAELRALGDPALTDTEIVGDSVRIYLELPLAEWPAWETRLQCDAGRTTNRGWGLTAHGTWNGVHIAIRCYVDATSGSSS